jgi:hypothetical protein
LLFRSLASADYQPLSGDPEVLYKIDHVDADAYVRHSGRVVNLILARPTGSRSEQAATLGRLSDKLTTG